MGFRRGSNGLKWVQKGFKGVQRGSYEFKGVQIGFKWGSGDYDKTISDQSKRPSGLAVESVTFDQKVMSSSLATVKGN